MHIKYLYPGSFTESSDGPEQLIKLGGTAKVKLSLVGSI